MMRRVQQPNENVDDFITCLHSLVQTVLGLRRSRLTLFRGYERIP